MANHYKQLNNLRNGITAENRTIYELTDGEISTLQQISDTSNLFAGGIARAILRQNGVPNEPWVYVPNTNVPKRVAIRLKNKEENEEKELFINETNIFPNPTSTNFSLQVNLNTPNATLNVYTLEGKRVHQEKLTKGQQTYKVVTLGWAKGFYLIKVEQEGKVLFEEKLSLQ